jgi:hypothetical protein
LRTILIPLAAVGWLTSFAILAASAVADQPERMSATVKTLASDAFEGRAPGLEAARLGEIRLAAIQLLLPHQSSLVVRG